MVENEHFQALGLMGTKKAKMAMEEVNENKDVKQIPAPSEQHKQGRDGERRHERTCKTAQRREKMEPRGSGQ